MADRNLNVRVTADTHSLEAGLRRAQGASTNFANHIHGRLVGGLQRVGRAAEYGASVLGVSFVGAIGESVRAAAQAQTANALLEKSAKNAGISWKQYGGFLKGTATQAAEAAGFMRTDLVNALAKLTTTTGSAMKANDLLGASMNLARARGLTLSQTSTILSKVWNGNTTSLVRLGISLPKVTKNYDALMAKAGTATAAQKAAAKAADLVATRQGALAALQQKFGGAWEAYSKTASGSLARLRASADIVFEELGRKMLPYLQRLAQWIIQNLPTISSVLGSAFSAFATSITTVVSIGQHLIGFYQRWSTWIQAAAVFLGTLVAGVEAYIVVGKVAAAATRAWAVATAILNAVMDANPIAIAIIAAAALAAAFVVLWHRSETFRNIVHAVMGAVAAAIDWARHHWQLLIAAIPVIGPLILGVIRHFDSLRSKAATVFHVILTVILDVRDAIGWVIGKIQDLIGWLGRIHWPSPPSWLVGGPSWIDTGKIPVHGAAGGIVTRATRALIGEAGPEAVIPLSRAPGAYALPSGIGRGGDIHVHLHVRGSVIAQHDLTRHIRSAVIEAARRGVGGGSSGVGAGVFGGVA